MRKAPQLRFPGFEGEWTRVKLGHVSDRVVRRNAIGNQNVLTISAQHGLISQEDFFSKIVASSNLSNYYLLENGDFAYNKSYSKGYPMGAIKRLNSEKGAVSPLYVCFRPNNKINSDFLNCYFEGGRQNHELYKIAQEGVRNHGLLNIAVVDFFNIELVIPTTAAEQQKIADFLTAVDERIELQSNKVEKLQTHKRGLTQKIFTRTLRFKCDDGSDFPEWSTIRLREVLKERKQYATKDSAIEHISLTTSGVVPKSDRYERDFLVVGGDKKYKITELDDICYNPANLKFGVIARNKYGKGIFSPIYVTYCVKNNSPVFFEYYLVRSDFINKVRRYEKGTVYERMAVKSEDFLSEIIFLPCFEEQQKIANFLSQIDEKITLEAQKLEELKKFKKSLLQKMFV